LFTMTPDRIRLSFISPDTVLDVDCADGLDQHMRSAQRMTNWFLIDISMSASLWASSHLSIGMEIREMISSIVWSALLKAEMMATG
jgi:hypothetical protein